MIEPDIKKVVLDRYGRLKPTIPYISNYNPTSARLSLILPWMPWPSKVTPTEKHSARDRVTSKGRYVSSLCGTLPIARSCLTFPRILSGQDTKKFTVQLNGYYVDRISQGVISDDEAREQIKQQEDNSDDEGTTNEFWDSWSDIDFQAPRSTTPASVFTPMKTKKKSMRTSSPCPWTNSSNGMAAAIPTMDMVHRSSISTGRSSRRGTVLRVKSGRIRKRELHDHIRVGADYTFDPSKLVFHTDGIWHGVFLRTECIVGFGYDDKEAEIIEHGEGHWEASGGLPELAYFTVCGSAKWEFAAGEAIVRWWKCVLAKRRFAELRRF